MKQSVWKVVEGVVALGVLGGAVFWAVTNRALDAQEAEGFVNLCLLGLLAVLFVLRRLETRFRRRLDPRV